MTDIQDYTLTDLTSAFNQYIVAPLNSFGFGGSFQFDIQGENTVSVATDITDHYLEDNTAVQDHIAVRPKRVTLTNYVGEVVFGNDNSSITTLQKVTQKLTILNQYLPDAAKGFEQLKQIYNAADPLDTANNLFQQSNLGLTDLSDLWALTKNLNSSSSRIVQAYQYFVALATQKILIGLQTPFEFLSNMAVESVFATSPQETDDMATFGITLKQIRVAKLEFTSFSQNSYQPTAGAQASPTIVNTNNQGSILNLHPITTYNPRGV